MGSFSKKSSNVCGKVEAIIKRDQKDDSNSKTTSKEIKSSDKTPSALSACIDQSLCDHSNQELTSSQSTEI